MGVMRCGGSPVRWVQGPGSRGQSPPWAPVRCSKSPCVGMRASHGDMGSMAMKITPSAHGLRIEDSPPARMQPIPPPTPRDGGRRPRSRRPSIRWSPLCRGEPYILYCMCGSPRDRQSMARASSASHGPGLTRRRLCPPRWERAAAAISNPFRPHPLQLTGASPTPRYPKGGQGRGGEGGVVGGGGIASCIDGAS